MNRRRCYLYRGDQVFVVIFDVNNPWRAVNGVERLLANQELGFGHQEAFEISSAILRFLPGAPAKEPLPPPIVNKNG